MKISYKEMLRDRITKMQAVDLALKYCKAKTKWINYVYKNFIGIYVHKKERNQATRIILGISGKYREFNFHTTIDWESLKLENKTDEIQYWERVEEWIEWFSNNIAYIEDDLNHNISQSSIMKEYGIDSQLLEYIKKSL